MGSTQKRMVNNIQLNNSQRIVEDEKAIKLRSLIRLRKLQTGIIT